MASLRNKHVLIQFMLPVKISSQSVYVGEGKKLQTCFFPPQFLDSEIIVSVRI